MPRRGRSASFRKRVSPDLSWHSACTDAEHGRPRREGADARGVRRGGELRDPFLESRAGAGAVVSVRRRRGSARVRRRAEAWSPELPGGGPGHARGDGRRFRLCRAHGGSRQRARGFAPQVRTRHPPISDPGRHRAATAPPDTAVGERGALRFRQDVHGSSRGHALIGGRYLRQRGIGAGARRLLHARARRLLSKALASRARLAPGTSFIVPWETCRSTCG